MTLVTLGPTVHQVSLFLVPLRLARPNRTGIENMSHIVLIDRVNVLITDDHTPLTTQDHLFSQLPVRADREAELTGLPSWIRSVALCLRRHWPAIITHSMSLILQSSAKIRIRQASHITGKVHLVADIKFIPFIRQKGLVPPERVSKSRFL